MRQELFNQGETDYAYNLLNTSTIEDVDRIYELRRLINERLQNLPNPWRGGALSPILYSLIVI